MSGYVFHCTPCGHAHAGECPTSEPTTPRPRFIGVSEGGALPAVGSRWRTEHLQRDGTWLSVFSQIYVVIKIENGRVFIKDEVSGFPTSYNPDAWSVTGLIVGIGWRFVAVP